MSDKSHLLLNSDKKVKYYGDNSSVKIMDMELKCREKNGGVASEQEKETLKPVVLEESWKWPPEEKDTLCLTCIDVCCCNCSAGVYISAIENRLLVILAGLGFLIYRNRGRMLSNSSWNIAVLVSIR